LKSTSQKVYPSTSQLIQAHEIREVIAKYDPKYMAASLDEAYLNVTSYILENNLDPTEAVSQLRAEIFEKTKITTSAGLGANTLLAKIGSNKNKVLSSYVSVLT
jgi:DNA polymerase kappa